MKSSIFELIADLKPAINDEMDRGLRIKPDGMNT
jgi:hypothetical protein